MNAAEHTKNRRRHRPGQKRCFIDSPFAKRATLSGAELSAARAQTSESMKRRRARDCALIAVQALGKANAKG